MAGRLVPEIVTFDPLEPDEVVATMAAMAAAHRGWVNFEPEVPTDDEGNLPDGAGTRGGPFSNRGPAIPLATWTAATRNRRGVVGPQSIGVQHGTGARARERFRLVGLEVPAGWLVRTDHPKRGLVVEVPADVAPAEVLDWLLAAGETLTTVPVTGRWLAACYPG